MILPISGWSDAQRVFIENTLAGHYDDGPGKNPATRRALRNALDGMYRATKTGNALGFQQNLATWVASSYRQLDTLTAEDFAVFHIVTAPAMSSVAETLQHLSELHVYTSTLQLTRTIQSPELRQRYGLDTGQQRPLPL